MEEMKQDQKTIGPLPGCQLEEALALVWDVFSTFESEELSQEALDEFWSRIDYEYMLQRAGDGDIRSGAPGTATIWWASAPCGGWIISCCSM